MRGRLEKLIRVYLYAEVGFYYRDAEKSGISNTSNEKLSNACSLLDTPKNSLRHMKANGPISHPRASPRRRLDGRNRLFTLIISPGAASVSSSTPMVRDTRPVKCQLHECADKH